MATYEYLDQTKLQYTLNKLKTVLDSKYKCDCAVTGYYNATTGDEKIATITIGNTPVDIYVPKRDTTMSDDSTNAVQNKVIKKYVDDAVGAVVGIKFERVTSLPTTGENGVIYLLSKSGTPPAQNVYEEYIWISADSDYEKIGDTAIDLTDYVKTSDIAPMTNAEIDAVFTAVFPS